MDIYGKKYTVKQLRQRVGNLDQVAAIRTVRLDDGNERPTRAALIHTGSGLQVTVLLDRCLDIASASYQGRAMGWRSVTGDVAPQYYEAEGLRWLRSYFGGLVTTCGLTQVGAPAQDSPLSGDGLHGRIGNTPAKDIQVSQAWEGNDYVLSVSGVMRQAVVFGENLTLRRTVSTKLGAPWFRIRDVLTNEGFNRTQFMLLYHCNVGWPAVDEGSRLITPSRLVAPRDAEAVDGQERWHTLDAPTHGYAEKCYYHDMAPQRDGSVTTAIVNDGFDRGEGFGVYVKYNKKQLPRFVEWKMMGEQDYVVGLEPCTCGVEGRDVDNNLGLQQYLAAGESRTFELEFGAIRTAEDLAVVEKAAGGVQPKLVDRYTEFVKPD